MEYLADEARAKNALFTRADANGARSISAFTTNSGSNHGKKGPRWQNAKKDGKTGDKSDEKTPAKVASPKARRTRLQLLLTLMILASMSLVKFGGP